MGRLPPHHGKARPSGQAVVPQWHRRHHEDTRCILPALQKIDGSCVIDGEMCALDEYGRSRFQLLQNALNKKAKLLYLIFDVLVSRRQGHPRKTAA